MKAASLIIQFVIFFTIGLGFFLLSGNLFRFQSDLIKQDILGINSNLSVSQVSAVSIRASTSCKSCDNVTIKLDQKSIAGYIPTYQLLDGIILNISQENKTVQSSVHNLNHSINFSSPALASSQSIDLTYDRTKNKLVIE